MQCILILHTDGDGDAYIQKAGKRVDFYFIHRFLRAEKLIRFLDVCGDNDVPC